VSRTSVIGSDSRRAAAFADRPRAVAALTKIFLDEVERLLCAAAGVAEAANTPSASRPRLGGISFLHRFGSALKHHVHLHACVTDGVFVPAADQAGCDAPPTFLPARPITAADLAALTERVRRRVIRFLPARSPARRRGRRRHARLGEQRVFRRRECPNHAPRPRRAELFSESRTPAAVLHTPALRTRAIVRDADGRIIRIRYVLPRHKAANWVGRGRGRKSTRPGANGVVERTPFEFLDRLADPVPPPRKHRHRYHGVFAPNHKLRRAVTAIAIGNIGKRCHAATGEHAGNARATEGYCDTQAKPRSHDTSRIAWAKLMARVREEFPLECPACGGDIRLRGDGRQEPAHFEPEVRKREKARMRKPA
jgi:hypothetical protein